VDAAPDTEDRTDQKQPKIATSGFEDRFALFVDAVKDCAIIMLDQHGTIAVWNRGAEHLIGYSAGEALGRHYSMMYQSDDFAVHGLLQRSREHGRTEVEGWRQRKDQTLFWAHTLMTPVYERDELIGYSEITRDLTERRKLEQQLRELNQNLERLVHERTAALEAANKELEAFSYSVSHDLRAPLRSIDGFVRVLMEDYAPELEPEIVRNLQIISRNAVRMGELIDDLLAFSRLSRLPLTTSEVDMHKLAQSCVDSARSQQAPERDIQVSILPMPDAVVDRAMMQQVLLNLVSNAMKFTSKRDCAEIEIGSVKKEGVPVYYVKDNGAGFDMKYADKLFSPFQRLHKSSEYPGTGIGLALVHRILSRHNGSVWIDSSPALGTTVFFTAQQYPNKGKSNE
jgi:PAS domain S-box-containing protein